MIFAIDPDVFAVAENHWLCEQTLNDLAQKAYLQNVKFAVDGDLVEMEYLSFYKSLLASEPDHSLVRFLQELLSDNELRYPIPIILEPLYEQKLQELGCTEPVEPQLLGMVANARKLNVQHEFRLLLVGESISHPKARNRRINEAAIRNHIKNLWPWIDVRFASDGRFQSAAFDEDTKEHPKSREFENEVALYFQKQRGMLRCEKSPLPTKLLVNGKERDIGDIDVYGIEEYPDRIVVFVAECKLRDEGKESKRPVITEEINKHLVRMEVVRTHKTILDKAKGRVIIVEGAFVSNADDFGEGARELLNQHGVTFYRATLTKNWTNDQHWKLLSLTC